MATISVLSLPSWSQLSAYSTDIIAQVKRAERKTFPRSEALDFDTELFKRNVELMAVVEDAPAPRQLSLVAYLVITRIHSMALLHKLCVLERYRRRGIASQIMRFQCERLTTSGCIKVQLWVDEQREGAQSLYYQVGFEEVERVNNYYGPGRTGIKMVRSLFRFS